MKSEGKRNTDRKASRNQQTEQAEKQKNKAKSQGKETEEPKEKLVQMQPLRVNLFLNPQTSMLLRLMEIRIMNLQMYPYIVLRIVRKVIKKNNYKLSYYEI